MDILCTWTFFAANRIKITTGRFLSGDLNVYQRISPRSIVSSPRPVHLPKHQIRPLQQAASDIHPDASSQVF